MLPTLFISHGSPMLALTDTPAHRFLRELGQTLPRPRAILMLSAHWETPGGPAVSLATQPDTIHDFGGFPQALFDIQYPAKGAPETASEAATLLEQAGFAVHRSGSRGLDHGAWVPLRLMYPEADIPMAQISLIHGGTPAEHERLGRALGPLRAQGVLIVGSGSLTHNLQAFRSREVDTEVPSWVSEFAVWTKQRLQGEDPERDHAALLDYRTQAPSGARNHPTEEHLLPLFVAMGAGCINDKDTDNGSAGMHAQVLHDSYEYGILSMAMIAFGGAAPAVN